MLLSLVSRGLFAALERSCEVENVLMGSDGHWKPLGISAGSVEAEEMYMKFNSHHASEAAKLCLLTCGVPSMYVIISQSVISWPKRNPVAAAYRDLTTYILRHREVARV